VFKGEYRCLVPFGVVVVEGEEAFAICNRVRRTSWGYVASDAIILEAAEHIRIVDGDREDWFPSGSVCQWDL